MANMKIVERTPSKWYTSKGKVKPSELTQQQLSNIYWYFYIIQNTRMDWAAREIQNRFKGAFLEYSPTPDFKAEIKFLEEKGLIVKTATKREIAKRILKLDLVK